ncbi:cytochrome P450 [Streptomyces sp. WAC05374]|uniref:cytochrome P450 n=1 Tax=Streptomyces sp. WAC05374 TaxID=2487420 RepID=UPI000F884ECE|nr:cytochrome P450 [Streptomyces sp. WAC05374]RST17668.1 cytochrome P450 [Streptomyces sp. WAC05374]TDF54757.1 cytochrome P450 [Streptomyces sp. WAC05374]TDF56393.1 cytochrome P450 [Streptomyces sp. WAC05374]
MEEWERWERRVQTAAHPVAYRLMRAVAARGPAVRVPRVGVVVSDAGLARQVLTDTEAYTKTGPGAAAALWSPVLGSRVLITLEGAEHAALRRRLGGLFTQGHVAGVCERVLRAPLGGLERRLAAGEEVDLVGVVRDGAAEVIRELVGLPAGGSDFTEAAAVVSSVRLWRRSLTGRQLHRARAALARLSEAAVESYRSGDESTVPGRLRALGLDEAEARGAVGLFLLTGTETLVSFVPRLVALAHDTGRGPDEITDALVEEALRVTSPTPVMLRSAARAGRIGGVRVEAGERVVIVTLLCTGAYGPFSPERDPSETAGLRRLWFGAGPHFCLGMPLAMAETRAVADALRGFPDLAIAGRRPARGVLIPAYARLSLRAAR